jgi:tRNA (guanine37-N1)-methyltransferase
MIQFDILTLFPEIFQSSFGSSLTKKACDKGLIKANLHNIRDHAPGKHRVTDDSPFGGGGGMVMKVEPVHRTLETVVSDADDSIVILLSPQGRTFSQEIAESLTRYSQIVLICGHYEGIDERIRTHLIDDEISIGDYVLTGGEVPAMVVVDAVSRLIPGFVGNESSVLSDSYTTGLLEGPHYTRPREYKGWKVPEVLLSGHEKRIAEWRRRESLRRTRLRRPDLLKKVSLSDKDLEMLKEIEKENS